MSISLPKSMPHFLQETCSSMELELAPMLSESLKRWRRLSVALHSSWAFSQARKKIVKKQDAFINRFMRHLSYIAITVEPECFSSIDKLKLSKLVKDKNINQLNQFGGVQGLVSKLKTHVEKGVEVKAEGISLRRQTFGPNEIRMPAGKMLQIVLETFKDPILIVLFLSASLSLSFGIITEGLERVSDGLFIFASIFLVVAAISFSNIWPARQFHALSKSNNNFSTVVIRDGREQWISANDVVVGDLVCLQTGDQVPADGLYIDGNSFGVDESVLKKEANSVEITNDNNQFLLAGSKVTNGYAQMLVTAVGMDTEWGEMTSSRCPTEVRTPLQLKLHKLTLNTARLGLAVASMVFIVLLIQYFTGNMKDDSGVVVYNSSKSIHLVCREIIGILATPIVMASATIPEGLLLAFTITLAYSTKRMAAQKAILRNLAACEAIGSITVICVDRSGTISSNSPKVEQFWLGGQMNSSTKWNRPSDAEAILQLILEGIGLNTTTGSSSEFDELQTEQAICAWAVKELGMELKQLNENCCELDIESLNLPKKQGSICIRRNTDKTVHIHMKGPIDMILDMCSGYYEENGDVKTISSTVREGFKKIIQDMKNNGLDCIAYAHSAVPRGPDDNNDEHFHATPREENFTLIGFLGLKDLFQPNISKALTEWKEAGVNVKMITTEDVPKAKVSALKCGVFSPYETITTDDVIEGRDFRNMTDPERLEKVERLSVIAGASTSDKLLLVQCLKQKGYIVAVIGGRPGDEIVFEEADVSFYPGIQKSDSMMGKWDIIISDDSFTPIARAMRWGRGMHNNIQLFAEFQLTATIVSLVTDSVATIFGGEPPTINIVTAISSGKIPFAAFQILWVKLIVGTLVVLALSIDDPAESLMEHMPVDQREPFITNVMWRDIIGKALCQITILLTIQFEGESTFKLNAREKDTLIFNILVLCQISSIFNRVEGKNIFERLKKKKLFWTVIGIIIILQVVIVESLKRFAGTQRLDWKQWRACIGLAIISWLVGGLVTKIPVPNKPFLCCLCGHKSHE